MTSREFAYWLQGYFELTQVDGGLTAAQADCIRRHLATVFIHEIDPSAGPPAHQAKLDEAHHGPKPAVEPTGKPNAHMTGGHGPGGLVMRC